MATSYTYQSGGQSYTATPMAGTTAPPVAPAGTNIQYTPVNQPTVYTTSGGQRSTDPNALSGLGGLSVYNPAPINSGNLQQNNPIQVPSQPVAPKDYSGLISGANAGIANGLQQYGQTLGANNQWTYQPLATDKPADVQAQQGFLDSLRLKMGLLPQKENVLNSPEYLAQKSSRDAAQQQVNDATSQINSVVAKQQTDLLSTRGQASSNGVTEAVYGGISNEINREAAIRVLPLQASLAAAQGNLALAQQNLKDVFDMKTEISNNKYDYQKNLFNSVSDYLDKTEKYQLDKLKTEAEHKWTTDQEFYKAQYDVLQSAVTQKAPTSIVAAINSTTPEQGRGALLTAAGQYGGDQLRSLQIEEAKSKLQKAVNEAKASNYSTVSINDEKGNPITLPLDVAPYFATSNSGINYIDASTLQGTAGEKKKIIDEAQAAGLKVITNKNSVLDLVNIKDANSKLDTATTLLKDVDQPDALARDLYGYGLTQLGVMAQTNSKAAIAQSLPIIGLDILKAISGVQGFRGNQTAIQQVQDHLPKPTDTNDVVLGKIEFIRKLMSDRENAIVGKPKEVKPNAKNTTINGLTVTFNGQTVTFPSIEKLTQFKTDYGL